MMLLVRTVVVGLLLSAGMVRAAGLAAEIRAQIDERAAKYLEQTSIPGMSLAVGVDNQLAYERGYGMADLENEVPATAHTVYRLASVSKMLTAVGVLQLVEAGKLDLAVPIQTYVPGFPEKQAPINCDLLLKHQSGIRHYKLGETESTRAYARVRDAFAVFQDDPLLFEPGTRFSYTTYGYNVLGAAIEGASREEYDAYVRRHIADPCGVRSLRPDRQADIIPHRAAGYRRRRQEVANDIAVDVSNKIPGGGWCSNPGDLVRFATALVDGKLLQPATLEQMWTPKATAEGTQTTSGYGCFIDMVEGDRLIYHSGSQPQVSTFLVFSPSREVAVALMCNLTDTQIQPLAYEILELVSEAAAVTAGR